jgi:hypothetical protein
MKLCRYLGECLFFPDEAWFHLNGYVNSQNSRFWSSENPHLFQKFHYTPRKLAVGVRYLVNGLCPIFSSETVTAEKYQETIMQFHC